MFKEYFDINISENIETIIVYLYESGEQQKKSDLSLKWPKKYRLYHNRLSVRHVLDWPQLQPKQLLQLPPEPSRALFFSYSL